MKYTISVFLMFLCLVTVLSRNLSKTDSKSFNSIKDIVLVDAPVVTTTEVTTLVEYPVTASTSISYYYPYFYKTKLISFNDEIDTTVLITTCPDNSCGWCDPLSFRCMKCAVGYFLSGDVCVSYCPQGYITDVLRFRCVAVTLVTAEVVSTKAYSSGSCKNTCGKEMADCSCKSDCKKKGNCCTDYDIVNCEIIYQKNNNVQDKDCEKNTNCLYCDNDLKLIDGNPMCNQCKDKLYLYEGKCYTTCPESTVGDNTNFICKVKPTCNVENCDTCNAEGKCTTCMKGNFFYNGACSEKCPIGYRADRITWTCLEPPVFAWYWVYPSRSSCKNYCGVVVQEFDCSCSADCFLYGNCCQDIEYVCPSILFWRKKATNDKAAPAKKSLALPSPKIKNEELVKKDASNLMKASMVKNTNTK